VSVIFVLLEYKLVCQKCWVKIPRNPEGCECPW